MLAVAMDYVTKGVSSAFSFAASLPNLIRALAYGANVKVIFHRGGPKTTGDKMYLPHIPFKCTPRVVVKFLGHVHHELAHILFTQFDVLKTLSLTRLEHGLLNAIEDPRIEVRYVDVYPGAHEALVESTRFGVEDGGVKDDFSEPAEALKMFVNYWGEYHLVGCDSLETLLEKSAAAVEEYLGASGFQRLEALMASRFHGLRDTWDAMKMAQEIVQLVQDIDEEQQQDEQEQQQNPSGNSPSGDDSQAGGSGDGSDTSGDSDDGSTSSSSDSSGDQDDVSSDAGAQQGSSNRGKRASDILDDDAADSGVGVDRSRGLEDLADEAMADSDGGVTTADMDAGEGISWTAPRNGRGLVDILDTIAAQVGTLMSAFRQLVGRARQGRERRSLDRGQFSGRDAWRLKTLDFEIRAFQEPGYFKETAISLVIDFSTSMNQGDRHRYAAGAAYAITQACDQSRIPVEVLAFGGSNNILIKSFAEGFNSVKPRFGASAQLVAGSTPMAETMYEAGFRLSQRAEGRKFLMVCTDGEPNNEEAVRQLIEMFEADGIEVIGIGIDAAYVKEVFPVHVNVQQLSELGHKMLGLLRDRMFRK